jgi:crotonobetainyl-CoA:carnitine CoA-transferase CaiB-like acyl-CoA transferase
VLPLAGVRVLDLSRVLAGPYATMVLADLGADVLKVEHPERGDDTRHWGPPFAGDGAGRQSAYFLSVNRNKRSAGLDLKSETGLRRAKQLALDADVLVENMRRGTLDRMGLGHEALRKENPRLVYCSITGYGPGPDRDLPGYDFLVQARGGVMGITGFPDGEPTKVGVAIADVMCGMHAATAILAALHRRSATGEGARVEVPLFESQLSWLANRGQEYLVSGRDTGRLGNAHPSIVPYQTFGTSDGTIAVAAGNDTQFGNLCRAIGQEALADDERFATNPDRVGNREALIELLQEEFSRWSTDEWLRFLQEAGVLCAPVNSLSDVFADDHVLGSGMVADVEHPGAGPIRMLRSPVLVDDERPPIRRPPPTLGQDAAAWESPGDVEGA